MRCLAVSMAALVAYSSLFFCFAGVPEAQQPETVLSQAREQLLRTLRELPNVLCQQKTDRFRISRQSGGAYQESHIDTITAIARRAHDGSRTYTDVKVDGKIAPVDSAEGMWSTNDFSSSLELLFAPSYAPEFRFERDSRIGDTAVTVFRFRIPASAAPTWPFIKAGDVTVRSAYAGRIWIAKNSFRVVRIRAEATSLGHDFPYETWVATTDYTPTQLGNRTYDLPVRTESRACLQGASECYRNRSVFSHCQLFTVNHQITQQRAPLQKRQLRQQQPSIASSGFAAVGADVH